jgi:hypothetical protein
MLDLVMSVLTGGATGLIGTVISGGMKFFENKQKHGHELAIMEMEIKQMGVEAQIAKDVAELEMEGKDRTAAWAALEASYKESTSRMSTGDSGWLVAVDVVRGLMRPVITLGLLIMIGAIYFTVAVDLVGPDGTPMRVFIINTVLYVGTTAVLWWFGTRNLSPSPRR